MNFDIKKLIETKLNIFFLVAETITGCPDSANEVSYCTYWSNPANGVKGQQCTDNPEYMCKCCKGYCSGLTCPGEASTVSTVESTGTILLPIETFIFMYA